MGKLIALLFLLPHLCFAGTVTLGDPLGMVITYSDEWSFKELRGRDFRDRGNSMNGLTIYASIFSRETPDSEVFPPEMKGTTFVDCDLSNIIVPEGNTVIGGTQKQYKAQNDLEDWLIGKNGLPIEPIAKEKFIKLGISIDPANIPAVPKTKSVTQEKEELLIP